MDPLDIAPDDVLRAAGGKYSPWLAHPKSPLPSLTLDADGWTAFKLARDRGYLVLPVSLNRNVEAVWSWWCFASKMPEVVARYHPLRQSWDVRLDLSPARLVFTPTALIPIGQAFRASHRDEEGWIVAPDTCQIDGLDVDTALALVDALLQVVAHPRCVRRSEGAKSPETLP